MFKKIIEEITRALSLAILIIVAMFVIKAADLDLDSRAKVFYIESEYAVGQIWQYHTRPGEENSTVQIIGIDKYIDEEAIIHISVKGLKMKTPMTESGISEEIGHLAFSRTAFSESVTNLLGMSEVSADAKKSHEDWQVEYETEGGGMFTVGIAQMIELVEQGMDGEMM